MTAKLYTFDGKTMTISEWSEHTGITRSTLCKRICSGWPIERALTEPVDHRMGGGDRGQTYTFNGETLTIPQWARKLGFRASMLRERIIQLGWPIERALTQPSRRKAANQ